MANLHVQFTERKTTAAYSKLIQTLVITAGYTNAITGRKNVSDTAYSYVVINPSNKSFSPVDDLSGAGKGELILIPKQLTELEAKLAAPVDVELYDADTEYAVVVKSTGIVQFGCTPARPTVVKALIDLRKKFKGSRTSPLKLAPVGFPVMAIEAVNKELLNAATDYLLDNVAPLYQEQDSEYDADDLKDNGTLYIYTKWDPESERADGYITIERPEDGNTPLKKHTLTLPKDWDKLYAAVAGFIEADLENAVTRATGRLDSHPATMRIGDYYVSVDSHGGIYINDDVTGAPEDGTYVTPEFVDKVIAAWQLTEGAK